MVADEISAYRLVKEVLESLSESALEVKIPNSSHTSIANASQTEVICDSPPN